MKYYWRQEWWILNVYRLNSCALLLAQSIQKEFYDNYEPLLNGNYFVNS